MSTGPKKSCLLCPSYLPPDKAKERFGRPIAAPMCAATGAVLGFSGQPFSDHEQSCYSFAENCEHFGKPAPEVEVTISARVARPSSEVIDAGPTGSQVGSCHACTNCVKHDTVSSALGWPLPLCKAKGTLIFNPTKEALACPWASPGMPSSDVSDVEILPEFMPGYHHDRKAYVEAVTENASLQIDPATYPSDIEVEEDDYNDGIRAWRRITCPFGTGKELYLPIFRRDIFTEEEQSRIPSMGDQYNPELYVDYGNLLWRFGVTTWTRGRTLLIQSLPGLGKTQFTYWAAYLMQIPWTRIFFSDSIEWDDIFGKLLFLDGETVWQDGRFTEAFTRPGMICEDEPNLARSEIISTLRPTNERVPVLYLDAGVKGHEPIVKYGHRYNFRVMCSNPAWDHRNIGTKEFAAADVSRISPYLLEPPPIDIEREIIKRTVLETEGYAIPDDLLNDLMGVSADLRELSKHREYPGTWGIRENIDVAANLAWYPFEEAFRMTALNYFEPEVSNFIIESSINTVRQ